MAGQEIFQLSHARDKTNNFITLLDSGAHRLQRGEKLGSGKAGSTGYDYRADRAQPTDLRRSVV